MVVAQGEEQKELVRMLGALVKRRNFVDGYGHMQCLKYIL